MQPLKITFTFLTELVESYHPIHFDSIVAYLVTQENGGNWENIKLPIAKENDIYMASALKFNRTGRRLAFRKRGFDQELFIEGLDNFIDTRTRTLRTASGPYKNYAWHTPVFTANSAEAWCIGEREPLSHLINQLRSIGPLGKLGYGAIKSVTIEYDEQARVLWQHRVLPWRPNDKEFYPINATCEPPYWDKRKLQEAWIHESVA